MRGNVHFVRARFVSVISLCYHGLASHTDPDKLPQSLIRTHHTATDTENDTDTSPLEPRWRCDNKSRNNFRRKRQPTLGPVCTDGVIATATMQAYHTQNTYKERNKQKKTNPQTERKDDIQSKSSIPTNLIERICDYSWRHHPALLLGPAQHTALHDSLARHRHMHDAHAHPGVV